MLNCLCGQRNGRYIQVDDRNSAQFDGVHVYCGRKTCLECGSSSNTHTCMVDVSPMVWYESIKLLGRVDRMTIVRHSQDDVIRSVRWLIRDLSVPFSRRYTTGGGTHSALSKTDRPLLWLDKLRLCRTDKITLRNSRFCRSYSIINVFHAIVVSPRFR